MPATERKPIRFTFRDRETRTPVAEAIVPEGYIVGATLTQQYANDMVPLHAYICAFDEDKSINLYSNSKGMWEQYVNPMIRKLVMQTGIRPSNLADFVPPEAYLRDYAAGFTDDHSAVPVASAELPGAFADNRAAIRDDMVRTLMERDGSMPNVQLEVLSAVCQPMLMKFTGRKNGRDAVILAGFEFMGMEYRNAITPAMMMGGGFGLLAGLFGAAKRAKTADTPAPFGRGREFGKPVDVVRWGFNRLYACVCDAEKEAQATEEFLRFVLSFTPDLALTQRREQMAYEIFLRQLQASNQLAAQARQMQAAAQQRAMETSRMIARNSAEMSAGLMDSWNRRMASDSRISQSRSEAIRGVNTYAATGGRSVEADVTADHVYEDRYGDVYGVSGAAPDPELLSRLNWTELGRK